MMSVSSRPATVFERATNAVLTVILPPLLHAAARYALVVRSRRNLRMIGFLAIVLAVVSAVLVGVAVHLLWVAVPLTLGMVVIPHTSNATETSVATSTRLDQLNTMPLEQRPKLRLHLSPERLPGESTVLRRFLEYVKTAHCSSLGQQISKGRTGLVWSSTTKRGNGSAFSRHRR